MSVEYFFVKNGQKLGPVSPAILKAMAVSGELNRKQLVWKEGMKGWVEAGSLKGLFPVEEVKVSSEQNVWENLDKPVPPALPMNSQDTSSPEVRSSGRQSNPMSEGIFALPVLLATFVCCFPVGFVLLAMHPRLTIGKKIGISFGLIFGFLFLVLISHEPKNKDAGVSLNSGSISVDNKSLGTDTYLPHIVGRSKKYISASYIKEGGLVVLRKEHYMSDGLIQIERLKIGKMDAGNRLFRNGTVNWLNNKEEMNKFPEHYRIRDGFIEIGSHISEDDKIFWKPKMKINPRVKDTWNYEIPGVSKCKFTVTNESVIDGKKVLTVREDTEILAPNEAVKTVNLISYMKGFGIVQEQETGKYSSTEVKIYTE